MAALLISAAAPAHNKVREEKKGELSKMHLAKIGVQCQRGGNQVPQVIWGSGRLATLSLSRSSYAALHAVHHALRVRVGHLTGVKSCNGVGRWGWAVIRLAGLLGY